MINQVELKDLSLINNNSLNEKQLKLLLKKTPIGCVKQRPAKGGGTWDYVSGSYVRKVLNMMFGWDWDFEVVSEMVQAKQVIVKGKLTCRSNGATIVKMQFGCKDIMMRKGTDEPLNLGNDFKSASTDCLKKCAAEIGIAGDIYGKDDFKEVEILPPSNEQMQVDKETFRVVKFIANANDLETLESVYELAQKLDIIEIFNNRKTNIQNDTI
jgi:hypothetical protein